MDYDETVISRVVERYGVTQATARNVLEGNTFTKVKPQGRKVPRQRSRRKLTEEQVTEIKGNLSSPYWGQQGVLAAKYRVSRHVIQRIQYDTY